MFKSSVILLSLSTIAVMQTVSPTQASETAKITPMVQAEKLQEDLPIVRNQADLGHLPQRVRLSGQYVVTRRKPDPMSTGIPGFKGDYLTVQIILQDGTAIALESPLIKQSLRSEQEVKQYDLKSVEVIGRLEILPSLAKNQQLLMFIVPESISLSFKK
jgi:hypothetical protein